MPGLEQLKQFSEDVANLGKELTIREEKGEPIIRIPFPVDISEEDDSDDFVLGMPLPNDSNDSEDGAVDELSAATVSENEPADYSSFPELDSLLNPEPVAAVDFSEFPELDAILNPSSSSPVEELSPLDALDAVDSVESAGGFDLPDFGSTDSADSVGGFDLPDFDSPASADSVGGFDLPDFDSPASADNAGGFDLPDFDSLASADSVGGFDLPEFGSTDSADNAGGFDVPDFDSTDSADSVGGFDLPDFDSPASADSAGGFDVPDFRSTDSADNAGGFDVPDFDSTDSADSVGGFDLPDFGSTDSADSVGGFDLPNFDSPASTDDVGGFDLPDFDSPASADSAGGFDVPDFGSTDSADNAGGFDLPDFGSTDSADSVGGFDVPDFGSTDSADNVGGFDLPDFGSTASADSVGGFDLPDFGSTDSADSVGGFDLPDFDSPASADNAGGFDLPDFGSTDSADNAGGFDVPDFDSTDSTDNAGGFDVPDFDSTDSADSADGFDVAADDSAPITASQPEDRSAIDFGSDQPVKVDMDFATRPVHEADFHSAPTGEDSASEDELDAFVPETHEIFDAPEDPFDGEEPPPDEDFDDFVIPGISDQAAGMTMAKPKRPVIMGKDGKKEKNTLSDKEYDTFLKNLRDYPLNLRVELEKFIVGDEFKDDVVFDVIQKVIKKTSARQLATHLEKLLDISIPVPREFERRTAAQYEEYKKSAEYQLKNRILPIAIISVMAACIMYIIFLFGQNFIYEPLKANSLYKEGYALLEEGAYPQSEIKFDEALAYQQQKRWFFTYADGYRKHKQYERARMMYRAGLQRFKQDKELGLDYAEMELYDLRNFENAETVVRREVLDYHINDSDGLLLLGDIFLEWGDERDEGKYQEAKSVYDELIELYGQKDVYLARLMRYYIRVDDLRNVLQMKEYFYPKEKALNGQDLIELSGYLLYKSAGNIAPADEYLLSSIEDVRELLERAVEAAPNEPESLYNMGLYFVNTNNSTLAKDWLSAALTSFENASYKPRKRLLRQLNTFRLLGDLDVENKEYISAEEKYRMGISLFEKEAEAGLVGDRNVGQLYAALADINYLIIGDYDEALRNYTIASNTQYGTPSVYYKMGYINYSQKKYGEALNLFIKTAGETPSDTHVLYALGNVLSSRGDNFAAQGYYQRLMDILDQQRTKYTILFPQVNEEHEEIVEMYKMGANNLGVTLYRLSRQTGNSSMNAEALTNFTASIRAHDALERNQETLVRKAGTNLAEQNIKYMSQSQPEFEPSIYTEIPALPEGEQLPK